MLVLYSSNRLDPSYMNISCISNTSVLHKISVQQSPCHSRDSHLCAWVFMYAFRSQVNQFYLNNQGNHFNGYMLSPQSNHLSTWSNHVLQWNAEIRISIDCIQINKLSEALTYINECRKQRMLTCICNITPDRHKLKETGVWVGTSHSPFQPRKLLPSLSSG